MCVRARSWKPVHVGAGIAKPGPVTRTRAVVPNDPMDNDHRLPCAYDGPRLPSIAVVCLPSALLGRCYRGPILQMRTLSSREVN